MTNFIFKSPATYKKLANKVEACLDVLLKEQRLQRSDLNEIKYLLHKLQNAKDLQDTVDKYYKHAPDFDSDTIHQTRL